MLERICNEFRELGSVCCSNSIVVDGVRCCGDPEKTNDRNDQSKVWCSMCGEIYERQLTIFD